MRSRSAPAPLFVARTEGGGARARGLTALAATVALGLAVLATCTSGSAPSLAHVVLHVALGAIAASAAVSAFIAWRAGPGRGVEPGVYVFPREVVDARSRSVRVHSLEDAGSIVLHDRALAEELRREIALAIACLDTHDDARALESIAEIDEAPPTVRSAGRPGPAPRVAVALAMTSALVLGPASGAAAFSYAKHTNDDLRFARANAHPSVASYDEYLATGGGRYEAEVRSTLLPCAQLREIIAASPAIHDYVPLTLFVEKHPNASCTAEAKRVLADKIEGVRIAYSAP